MSDHPAASLPRLALRAGLLLCLLLVTACSGGTPDGQRAALPPAFADGVPEVSGDVVLTVTTAEDAQVDWDLDTLAMLDQQQLTIIEPFLDVELTFTGPLWADVLRASGIDLDAGDTIELVALDDYVAEIPTDDTTLDGAVLAHLVEGDPIAIEDGGPIRLVYPPDNPAAENANNWIWSIRTARVI
jgi:hypothetical protein